ncbi:MAG: peptidylprolyl isomerase [Pseudohongiellaceae bacterium]
MNRLSITAHLLLLCIMAPFSVDADEAAARLAMEDAANPLVMIDTSQGDILVELLADEAPQNTARFLALATGAAEVRDPDSGRTLFPNYYDGMRFHRVIPGFLIQTGSPAKSPLGEPTPLLNDEINASSLGLDVTPVILPDGSLNPTLNINDRAALEDTLLLPLYRQMRINSNEAVENQQFTIAERLQSMTVKQAYESLGYRYIERQPTRGITRGSVVLANQGPNSNGPEFFIAVADAPWLNGRHTVIGRVVDGMDVVDRISRFAIDPLSDNRQSTLIFSIRQL